MDGVGAGQWPQLPGESVKVRRGPWGFTCKSWAEGGAAEKAGTELERRAGTREHMGPGGALQSGWTFRRQDTQRQD